MSINVDSITIDKFWQTADDLQNSALNRAADLFALVRDANPKELLAVLVQYRFFTSYYTTDLAILISRMSDGRLRSFLADVLSDELGRCDPKDAHPYLYDQFLKSVGLSASGPELDGMFLHSNRELLNNAREKLLDPDISPTYGVGLRGMGGECVCQVYLSNLHLHLMRNPYIVQASSKIDWTFWSLHVGHHDVEHRVKTRQLIHDEIVLNGTSAIEDLARGYSDSMLSWTQFWTNIVTSVRGDVEVTLPTQELARRSFSSAHKSNSVES